MLSLISKRQALQTAGLCWLIGAVAVFLGIPSCPGPAFMGGCLALLIWLFKVNRDSGVVSSYLQAIWRGTVPNPRADHDDGTEAPAMTAASPQELSARTASPQPDASSDLFVPEPLDR